MSELEKIDGRPFSEFVAEIDARGIQEFGWLRWRVGRLIGKVRVRWWFFWHGHKPLTTSQEAMDAFTAEDLEEVRNARAAQTPRRDP